MIKIGEVYICKIKQEPKAHLCVFGVISLLQYHMEHNMCMSNIVIIRLETLLIVSSKPTLILHTHMHTQPTHNIGKQNITKIIRN